MSFKKQFSEQALEQIVEEAMIYMCACPGQVAREIRQLRELIAYQSNCEQTPDADPRVHQTIAQSAIAAHALMEDCLSQVLDLEGWDRETLKMPAGLRQLRDRLISDGD